MKKIFYIDESGNTGANWLDLSQPYFIYGGFLIAEHQLENINKLYLNWMNGLQRQSNKELKSSKIIKNLKGRRAVVDILTNVLKQDSVIPFIWIADKKFLLSIKLVETFFDPEYNPRLDVSFISEFKVKTSLANFIYNHDNGVLDNFSMLVKNGTTSIEHMKNIKYQLIKLLSDCEISFFSDITSSLSEYNLYQMIDEFETVSDNGEFKTSLALTAPFARDIFQNVNFVGKNAEIAIVHDELRGYFQTFKDMAKLTFSNGEDLKMIPIGDRVLINNYENVKTFEFAKSEDEYMIQLADLLMGFTKYTLSIMDGDTLTVDELELWDIIYKWAIKYAEEESECAVNTVKTYFTDDLDIKFYNFTSKI